MGGCFCLSWDIVHFITIYFGVLCVFFQHVNSPCYSSRNVPEDFSLSTLDDLDETTRKTVQFRTNMKSVPSICLHHKITYTNRFRVYLLDKKSNKCRNPLSIHLPKKRPNVSCSKTITLNWCEKISSKVTFMYILDSSDALLVTNSYCLLVT